MPVARYPCMDLLWCWPTWRIAWTAAGAVGGGPGRLAAGLGRSMRADPMTSSGVVAASAGGVETSPHRLVQAPPAARIATWHIEDLPLKDGTESEARRGESSLVLGGHHPSLHLGGGNRPLQPSWRHSSDLAGRQAPAGPTRPAIAARRERYSRELAEDGLVPGWVEGPGVGVCSALPAGCVLVVKRQEGRLNGGRQSDGCTGETRTPDVHRVHGLAGGRAPSAAAAVFWGPADACRRLCL